MAHFLKKLNNYLQTPPGRVLELLIYTGMLVLVMIYFTGNGQFIYEAF